jgi:hypothetical protein
MSPVENLLPERTIPLVRNLVRNWWDDLYGHWVIIWVATAEQGALPKKQAVLITTGGSQDVFPVSRLFEDVAWVYWYVFFALVTPGALNVVIG